MQLQLGRLGGEVRLGCVVRVQRGRQRGLCHVSCLCTVFSSLVACHKRSPHLAYQLCWRLIITGALHSAASHTCITTHTLMQKWQTAALKSTQRLCEPEMMNMQQTTLKFNVVHAVSLESESRLLRATVSLCFLLFSSQRQSTPFV